MMLKYAMVLMLGYLIQGAVIQENEDIEERTFSKKTERFLNRRCSKNSDEKQLEIAFDELDRINLNFLKTLPSHTDADDEGLEEACQENCKVVEEGVIRLMNHIDPCLPTEEKYLKDFIPKAYKGYSEYLCEHLQILTLTGLIESNMMKCINTFLRKKAEKSPNYICFESTKFGNHSRQEPIPKKEFCEDLDSVYGCYERQFKQHCADAPKAWEFQAGLLDGIRAPCNEDESDEDETTQEEK